MITLGNDLVDLGDAAVKHKDCRFLNRVFSADEQQAIAQSAIPHVLLWRLWAAKEAAFKAYQKQHLFHRFSPIKCQVTMNSESLTNSAFAGRVLIEGALIHCQWQWTEETVHCIALLGCDDFASVQSRIVRRTSQDDCQSTAVRRVALALCADKGLANVCIQREALDMDGYQKLGPPALYQQGMRLNTELSLSHDGDFVAAALLRIASEITSYSTAPI